MKPLSLKKTIELRQKYQAIETIWKFIQNDNENVKKKSERYIKAIEIAKEYGLDTTIYDDCLGNWEKVKEHFREVLFESEKKIGKEASMKLRALSDFATWPMIFKRNVESVFLSQYWYFTGEPKDSELFPIELHTANHVFDYMRHANGEWAEEGDWLEESFICNPRGLIRAVVYTEDREYEYNFQDLPVKSLIEKIKKTSAEWGDFARATGFDFDGVGDGNYGNKECLQHAWDAAPEDLRNKHIATVRKLVQEVWKYHQDRLNPRVEARTKYPNEWVAPIDKVSSKAFNGMLNYGRFEKIALEKKGSKKEITTIINIDFDDLGKNVVLSGRKELEPFDRDVHDAIVSLYVGGNELITPQMIYQVLTGNPNVRLTGNRQKEISESITKCMFTRVDLDASEDAKAYGFENLKYQGSLIAAEKITAKLNGQVTEALRVFRPPILYEYADKKNQIARFDIKLLNTPVNKTKEIITLQGYLQRRIVAMKGSKLSKNILYDTIYSQIQIEAETDGALKKKKSKIREQIREILNDWKAKEFIKDYKEETRGRELYSIKIELV